MTNSHYPLLFQVNTRVLLTQLTASLGRNATLDDIPDSELDNMQAKGFEWIWFLSVWQTGNEGQRISRTHEGWRKDFYETLPDLRDEDIVGSGFAITAYTVHEKLGGDAALARLRDRLAKRSLKLMLDFVPNHMALDHPWTEHYPEFFVQGTAENLQRSPLNYVKRGDHIFAYGRDPYFPGWPDTLQLNYGNHELQEALTRELIHISDRCDGVRCDMAMLIVPEVFERTWGIKAAPFWPRAILRVRDHHPGFIFMAEVYWDMEWELQQLGFDYTYDKRLYDRLRDGHAAPIHGHFCAGLDFQEKLARFLENHDEPRAAATFAADAHEAAAVLTYLSPGLRFFHQGQLEGRLKRISPHLVRAPQEPVNARLQSFYNRLMEILQRAAFHNGRWILLECASAWGGNESYKNYVAFSWEDSHNEQYVVAVNYASDRGQCFVKLPFVNLSNAQWKVRDLLSDATFDRDGNDLASRGMFLDEKPWKYYVFQLIKKRG